ncbi:ATP-binding cassette domain-containing protein [Flavobacterium sp.]|uniref:ATP-binding cassette domain-containing protein n=1 Tax=Flavobacterium sp. TaxID=239 RepID=UPI004048ABE8
MLIINILEKKYFSQVVLEKINLKIDAPGIYGLVGKNGQGKTTLFKCVLGLENYKGESNINDSKIGLQNIAWCPAEPPVYGELTAKEFYEFYSNLLELDDANKTPNPLFDIPDDKLIREFSTGMKKKVYLNSIFQKEYPIYFLDEPFNGLDLEANYVLIQYLIQKSTDSIIFISSHIMDILYNNCERIFVINNKGIIEFEKENYHKIQKRIFE